MRTKRAAAATLVCLSMVGCLKAGRVAPLVDNRPNTKLVERYNEDLGKRLNRLKSDLFKVLVGESETKNELEDYTVFESKYLRALETKCEGIDEKSLFKLHEEVMGWRTKLTNEMNRTASDITELIASLQSEKLGMESAEREVGQPVASYENKVMVVSLIRLSMNLREELAGMDIDIVPAPGCGNSRPMMVKSTNEDGESN